MRDTFVRRPHSRDVGFMQSNASVMLIPLVDGELKTATEIKEVAEAPWHFTLDGTEGRKLSYACSFPVSKAVEINAQVASTPFDDIQITPLQQRMKQFKRRVASKALGWAQVSHTDVKLYFGTGLALVGKVKQFTDYEVFLVVNDVEVMIYRHALLCIRAADGSNRPQHRTEQFNYLSQEWVSRRGTCQ